MLTKQQLSSACLTAADAIERDGFKKGSFGTNDGPKCAVGALRYACNGTVYSTIGGDTYKQICDLFRSTRPRAHRHVLPLFNDAKRTRKHDVVELLRDMAAKALA